MKNLKNNETTYSQIYEGLVYIPWTSPPKYARENTYWHGGISYSYERTHKLTLDALYNEIEAGGLDFVHSFV